MDSTYVWAAIFSMTAVTYGPRAFPLLFLSKADLPKWFDTWLRYIPTTIFGALIFSEIFVKENGLDLALTNIELLVSIATFILAYKMKSLAVTVFFGLTLYWGMQNYIF